MKPFNFNEYLKNNPLLKEDLESDIRKDLEKVSGIKNISPDGDDIEKLANKASDLYNTILRKRDSERYDDELIDDTMEDIVKEVGHTPEQKKKKGPYKFAFGAHPEFEMLTNPQLQAIITFLEAVIKKKEFNRFTEWDSINKKVVDKDIED